MAKLKFENALLMKLDSNTIKILNDHQISEEHGGNLLTRLSNDDLHVTLASAKSCRPHKEIIKTELPSDIQLPNVVIKGYRFCYRPDMNKISYVAFIENQEDFKKLVDEIFKKMNMENPEPDRLFHITMANNKPKSSEPDKADPFASIGDINTTDWQSMNESTNNRYQVWFDMDGVLADFEGAIKKNKSAVEARKILDDLIQSDFPQFAGLSNDDLKAKIKEEAVLNVIPDIKKLKKVFYNYNNLVFSISGKPGFFASLEMLPGAVEMLKAAYEITGALPNILTAPMGDENDPSNHSVIEKKEWCHKNLKGLFNHIECTIDKGRVVKSKFDILIDDRQKYINKFTFAGGTGIIHQTPTEENPESYKKSIIELQRICSIRENSRYITNFDNFRLIRRK